MSRLQYIRTIGPGELTATRVREALTRRVQNVPHWAAWTLRTSRARDARARLERYRNRHLGERCLVIANGPSIRLMDLRPARGMPIIGMNRGYRLCESHGVDMKYLVATDVDVQIRRISREMVAAPVEARFANWAGRRYFSADDDVEFVFLVFRPGFYGDVTRGVYGGHSVTYTCLQLAFFMGFRQVILVGKDHSYAETGTPGEARYSTGSEDNHFMPRYYEPGQLWRIPDYKGEEMAYEMARRAYESAGRAVLDATVGGRLRVFPKVNFLDVI